MTLIQVIDLATLQEGNRPTANLLGGPVIQIQLPRASTNLDPASAHSGAIAGVNALVAISDKEQIVGSQRNHGAKEAQRLRPEVLRLIDDDSAVSWFSRANAARKQGSGIAIRVVDFFQLPTGELSSILLEHRPNRVSLPPGKDNAATGSSSNAVLISIGDALGQNHLIQLLLIKVVWQ